MAAGPERNPPAENGRDRSGVAASTRCLQGNVGSSRSLFLHAEEQEASAVRLDRRFPGACP
jgi:hypothetical protein